MKWVQISGLALMHEFKLEGDETTILRVICERSDLTLKMREIFGPNVEIVTFDK
ncbi:hypothetical protein PV433_29980 [Paenibacillus sp. GYB004]|uniref:hypothetical protein n=1 Tax=Paenibacillus sp. GYB004 TaxID=2994393 RepID=UPI002F96E3E5